MKKGIFIYKYQPNFVVPYAGNSLNEKRIFGDPTGKQFLNKLNYKLSDLNCHIEIERNISNPEIEDIETYNCDFVILGPGYESKINPHKNSPKYFHVDEKDYNSLNVSELFSKLCTTFSK